MVTVERPRTNTVSPVGSELETSFMAASPQVKSAVAATIAAMPLTLRRPGCAESIWVSEIEPASELARLPSCTLPPNDAAPELAPVSPLAFHHPAFWRKRVSQRQRAGSAERTGSGSASTVANCRTVFVHQLQTPAHARQSLERLSAERRRETTMGRLR